MERITGGLDWCDLEQLASDIRAKLVYRRARCMHGYTRDETCRDCEGGYATDHATYAAGIGNVASWNGAMCWAVSDDGSDVAYLPLRFQSRIVREEPIEQLRTVLRGSDCAAFVGNFAGLGLERILQRIIARAHSAKRAEMFRTAEPIGVLWPESVDTAAWNDIKGLTPAQARPGVWFPGDGSAVATHYTGDGLPQYRRFVRV